jgi:hypothetical protein
MFTIQRNVPVYRTTYSKGFKAQFELEHIEVQGEKYQVHSRTANKLSLVSVPTRTFIGMRTKIVTYKSEAHYLKTLEKKNRPESERKTRTPKAHVPKCVFKAKELPKPKITKGPVQLRPSIKAVDSRPEPTFYELAYTRR